MTDETIAGIDVETGVLKVEAEDIIVEGQGYHVENRYFTSGGRVASLFNGDGSLTGVAGVLSYAFEGDAGSYDIAIIAFDENDGEGAIELRVNGVLIKTFQLDAELSSAGVEASNEVVLTVKGVELFPDDLVEITGVQGDAEWVRIDALEFTPLNDAGSPLVETFEVEAEAIIESGYVVSHGNYASDGAFVSLFNGSIQDSATTGQLRYVFDGEDGVYSLNLFAFDENDGKARVTVQVNGEDVSTFTLDAATNNGAAGADNLVSHAIAELELSAGDVVTVIGENDAAEWARIDKLVFTGVTVAEQTPSPTPTPTPTPEPTPAPTPIPSDFTIEAEDMISASFSVEANQSAASGGAVVGLYNSGDTQSSGTLTYTFDQTDGVYNLVLTAHDEHDGEGSIEVRVNGELIGSLVLDQITNPTSPVADANRVALVLESQSFADGDVVEITGYSNAGEWVRIDKLDFIGVEGVEPTPTPTPEPSNSAPIANEPVVLRAHENADYAFSTDSLLQGITDPDGDIVSIAHVDAVSWQGGTLVQNDQGELVYTPPAQTAEASLNAIGVFTDYIDYTVMDESGAILAARAVVIIQDEESAASSPVSGVLDLIETDPVFANTVLVEDIYFSNGAAPSASNLSIDHGVLTSEWPHRETQIGGLDDLDGLYTLTYQIYDSTTSAWIDLVKLVDIEQNEAPIGEATSVLVGTEDTPVLLTQEMLLQGFADPDGDALHVYNLSVRHGAYDAHFYPSLRDNGDQSWVVSTRSNWSGELIVSYTVRDSHNAELDIVNTLTINPANDAPAAGRDIPENFDDELLVNQQTISKQYAPDIVSWDDGRYIVFWSTHQPSGTIAARLFSANGEPLTDEFQLIAAEDRSNHYPSATILEDGNLVVSWSTYTSADDYDVRAQVFDQNANAVSEEFIINTTIPNEQVYQEITSLKNGGFVVTWYSDETPTPTTISETILFRIYNADGTPATDQIIVDQHQVDSPDVVGLETGGFVVSWTDTSTIKFSIYDDAGVLVKHVPGGASEHASSLQALPDGSFVVLGETLRNGADASGYGVSARVYSNTGEALTDLFVIPEETFGNQRFVSATSLSNGGNVVVWQGLHTQDGISGYSIKAQLFDADWNRIGAEFLVNTKAEYNQTSPKVAALPDGGFAITWSTDADALDITGGVKMRVFDANGEPLEVPNPLRADEDAATQIDLVDLLLNDWDVDNHELTITSVAQTSELGAVITRNDEGSIIYDPTGSGAIQRLLDGESLRDAFTYVLDDGNGGVDTAEVVVEVAGVSGDPIELTPPPTPEPPQIIGQAPTAADDLLEATTYRTEERLHESIIDDQALLSLDQLTNGNFVAVWAQAEPYDTSGGDIFARIFSPDGSPLTGDILVPQLNARQQYDPSILALPGGGFVVTWSSVTDEDADEYYGIKARLFTADGVPASDEFAVNEAAASSQYTPSVAVLEDGSTLAFTWYSFDQTSADQSGSAVKMRLFDINGDAVSEEFLVNQTYTGDQELPQASALPDNRFLISWEEYNSDLRQMVITGRIVSANPDADQTVAFISDEFLISEAGEPVDSYSPPHSSVALENGTVALTWIQQEDLLSGNTKYSGVFKILDGDGETAVGPVEVAFEVTGNDKMIEQIKIDGMADGGFVVGWAFSSGEVYAQLFDADGAPLADAHNVNVETLVDTTVKHVLNVEALDDGGYMVGWSTDQAPVANASYLDIQYRVFNADGSQRHQSDFNEDQFRLIEASTLLANDVDADGDVLSIAAVEETSAFGAEITLLSNGDLAYDPRYAAEIQTLKEGETLVDSFSYTIEDSDGNLATANVEMVVHGVNDAPVIQALKPLEIQAGDTYTFSVSDLSLTAFDPDGDEIYFSFSAWASNSTIDITDNGDGTWDFTVSSEASGHYTLSVYIEDEHGLRANAQSGVNVVEAQPDENILSPTSERMALAPIGDDAYILEVSGSAPTSPERDDSDALSMALLNALMSSTPDNLEGVLIPSPNWIDEGLF